MTPAFFALVSLIAPPRVRSAAFTTMSFFAIPGVAIALPLLGAASDSVGIQASVLALVPVAVTSGLILASAARFVRDDIDAAAAQTHDVNRPNLVAAGVAPGTLGGYGNHMAGYEMSKDDLLARLRRVEGQVRGIARMIEEDKYCIDVLTQVSAATKGLQHVGLGLFDDHLRHCVADAVAAGGPEANRKLTEATAAVERLVKS